MAEITAQLSLDVAKLKTGLEQAREEIKRFKGKAESEGKGVGESMGKGIALKEGIVALFSLKNPSAAYRAGRKAADDVQRDEDKEITDKLAQEKVVRDADTAAQVRAQEDRKIAAEIAEIDKLRLELIKATEKADWDALSAKQQLFSVMEKIAALQVEIDAARVGGAGAKDVYRLQIEQQKLKDQSLGLGKTVDHEMEADAKKHSADSKRAVSEGLKSIEDYHKNLEQDIAPQPWARLRRSSQARRQSIRRPIRQPRLGKA